MPDINATYHVSGNYTSVYGLDTDHDPSGKDFTARNAYDNARRAMTELARVLGSRDFGSEGGYVYHFRDPYEVILQDTSTDQGRG